MPDSVAERSVCIFNFREIRFSPFIVSFWLPYFFKSTHLGTHPFTYYEFSILLPEIWVSLPL